MTTLRPNAFRAALKAGRPQIGLWLSLASAEAAEVVAGAGFDWLLIDMEHAPTELSAVAAQLRVIEAFPGTALVRPDWNDPVKVKRLMDFGTPGLMFPMVQSAAEAKAAVAATRYPPKGIRGMGGITRANNYARVTDYLSRVEEETAILVQVETRAALAASLEIGQVDGVDGVFFGPSDIAADMGLLGQPRHPAVWEAILAAARPLIAAGIPVGTLVFDTPLCRRLIAEEGFTFVAVGADVALLARAADSLLQEMKAP